MTGHWLDQPDTVRRERDALAFKLAGAERVIEGDKRRQEAFLTEIGELRARLASREVWLVEVLCGPTLDCRVRTFTSYDRAQKWAETLPEGTKTRITQSWPDEPERADDLASCIRKALRA